jgi:SAM-dependent MidA family methyltransferase
VSVAKNWLEATLRAEISAQGPLPFIDYMARCLDAYYSQLTAIGAAGDFVTAPELGPYFAESLAHALLPHLAQYPVIVELGAGTGQLAFDLLQSLDCLGSLPEAYLIQEVSPALREVQALKLQALPVHLQARVSWQKPQNIAGILIANEVFDALPVERFIQTEAGKKRLGVDWQQDQFVEVILDEVLDFNPPGLLFENGYRSEFCPGLGAFLDTILPCFKSGMAWIIDYGYERQDYYAPHRMNGSMQAYSKHQEVSPLIRPGEVDLTAHVDFTTVAELMMARGWQIDFLKPQNQFMLEHKIMEHYALTPQHYALKRLLDPRLMGEVFKVMGAHRA